MGGLTLSPEVWMTHSEDPASKQYPLGRGYGHDYMRGGEVLGGYGYAERQEYETPRGALQQGETTEDSDAEEQPAEPDTGT
jgi:hypothetical protein